MKEKINLFFEDEEMEMATRQEMHQEAMRRLRMVCESYGLSPKIMDDWTSGFVNCFSTSVCAELTFVCNLCYFNLPDGVETATMSRISKKSQYARIIRKCEYEYDVLVYLALKNGPFLTLLYVSPDKESWGLFDELELPDAHFSSYVHDFQCPECSEFGDVRLCAAKGLLVRIA